MASSDCIDGVDVLHLFNDDLEHLICDDMCDDMESCALMTDLLATSHDLIDTVVNDLASDECPVDLLVRLSRKRRRPRLFTSKRKRARKLTSTACSLHAASPPGNVGA